VDQRGVASAYLVSDSRITWPDGKSWDSGRKLFAARRYPHLLGYCGDVLFPTQALSQIVDLIDNDIFAGIEGDVDSCLQRIIALLSRSFSSYCSSERKPFEFLYGSRNGSGLGCRFQFRHVYFDLDGTVRRKNIELPNKSGTVSILGSGQNDVAKQLGRWQNSDVAGTSRAIFSAFADALREGTDPRTGGPPQLIGLYRQGGGKEFGVLWEGRRYFYGVELESFSKVETIKWHNDLFEICDAAAPNVKIGAQRQPKPRALE